MFSAVQYCFQQQERLRSAATKLSTRKELQAWSTPSFSTTLPAQSQCGSKTPRARQEQHSTNKTFKDATQPITRNPWPG